MEHFCDFKETYEKRIESGDITAAEIEEYLSRVSTLLLDKIVKEATDKATNNGQISLENLKEISSDLLNLKEPESQMNIAFKLMADKSREDIATHLIWHPSKNVVVGVQKAGTRCVLTMHEILLCEDNNWPYSSQHITNKFAQTIDSPMMISGIDF